MKETGLMFKAPLVRSILDGSKTQTRRLVKLQPAPNTPHDGVTKWIDYDGLHLPVGSAGHLSLRDKQGIRCPMGKPGDRIYVRETWAPNNVIPACHRPDRDYLYAATDAETYAVCRWNPSIHMPKSASRIWLEVTGVRVERLQSITDADALAEGVDRTNTSISGYARERFKALWESTGGDWAGNPYVWVIDFKQTPRPKEQGS